VHDNVTAAEYPRYLYAKMPCNATSYTSSTSEARFRQTGPLEVAVVLKESVMDFGSNSAVVSKWKLGAQCGKGNGTRPGG